MESKVCKDPGNDARPPLDHRNCAAHVLVFAPDGDLLGRLPCTCDCHLAQAVTLPVQIVDEPEPVEVICSRCRALLEDSDEDYVESEAGMDALRMDRRFARQIEGRIVCLTCYEARFAGVR